MNIPAIPGSVSVPLLILTAFLCVSFGQSRPKPTVKPLNKTSVNDSKYGEGGKYVTYSDDKLKLLQEQWLDGDGNVRESHIISEYTVGDPNTRRDSWEFSWWDKTKYIVFYGYDGSTGKVEFDCTSTLEGRGLIASLSNIERKDVEDWINSIEERLSKKADFVQPWATKTNVETPVLTPLKLKDEPAKITEGKKCAIGSWISEQGQDMIDEFTMKISSGGLALEIGADGTASLKYDGIAPAEYPSYAGGDSKFTTSAQGSARAKLNIDDRNISISADVISSVKLTEKLSGDANGRVVEQKTFFPAEAQSVSYTCNGDVLVLKLAKELRFKRVTK